MQSESCTSSPKASIHIVFTQSTPSTLNQHAITRPQNQPAGSFPGSLDGSDIDLASQRSDDAMRLVDADTRLVQLNSLVHAQTSDRDSFFHGDAIVSHAHTEVKLLDLPNEILIHALSHLNPSDLLSAALVCSHFHRLVTHPDAWRIAFARYFPGESALKHDFYPSSPRQSFRSDRRVFGRLTALASWRNEYIVRSRLLRSVERARPLLCLDQSQLDGRRQTRVVALPVTMHETAFHFPITKIHASFTGGITTRGENVIFAESYNGEARVLNVLTGKLDRNWSTRSDIFSRQSFEDTHPEHELWGMGTSQFIGNDNPYDISNQYGVVVGEGCPGGRNSLHAIGQSSIQFLQTTSCTTNPVANLDLDAVVGMPSVPTHLEGTSSIWIAKSDNIPCLSTGMIGILSGSSTGLLSAYSLGHPGMTHSSLVRGQLTARWALSPGVPIIAIAVDGEYSIKRQAQNRIWAVALNALGELFYLTKFPKRGSLDDSPKTGQREVRLERLAWLAGRTVHWDLIEISRRSARLDGSGEDRENATYSPRSSWLGMCLSEIQIQAETCEITAYMQRRPAQFRQECYGWDMRYKLLVDFASDDCNHAGEAVAVVSCGLLVEVPAAVKRYIRVRIRDHTYSAVSRDERGHITTAAMDSSVAVQVVTSIPVSMNQTQCHNQAQVSTSYLPLDSLNTTRPYEEWRSSDFMFENRKLAQITCCAMDISKLANLTLTEDPLLAFENGSPSSSGTSSPVAKHEQIADPQHVPGQRARFISVGTSLGEIFIWNMRGSLPKFADLAHVISPVRIIRTSACVAITCLALNSLILVHGDNKGLVQAWDPLASQHTPLRTISAPFTGRLRRRVAEAQFQLDAQMGLPDGMEISLSAAAAIALDPDPTILRGIVTVGTHVKYWHFRADDLGNAERVSSRKAKKALRSYHSSSETTLNKAGGLLGFIKDELYDMKFEQKREVKERKRMQDRFGLGMLAEDESVRLAILLSEETYNHESTTQQAASIPRAALDLAPQLCSADDDQGLREAIRRSLAESSILPTPAPNISGCVSSASIWGGYRSSQVDGQIALNKSMEVSDLELALMLSMQDGKNQDRTSSHVTPPINDFPALLPVRNKERQDG